MTLIEQLRDKAYRETKNLLNEYGKAVIVRPTGFGKTGILTKLIRDYTTVLYLYPSEVILNTVLDFYYGKNNVPEDKSIPNTTCMTYHGLVTANDEKLDKLSGIDLIICDECHRLGGPLTKIAMQKLIERFPNAHIVGATATPERMDLVDEISMFFDNRTISSYTLHDAFADGILQKPHYCFCAFNYKNSIKELKSKTIKEIEKLDDLTSISTAKRELDHNLIEISNLVRMPNVIKTTCDEVLNDTSYMKFIIFCADLKHIKECQSKVKKWFKTAYPSHKLRTLDVCSDTVDTIKNVNLLNTLSRKDNTIDLIFSCEMLNMGYHIDDLTGIVMYRGTLSGIIYTQQLGRVLSTGTDSSGIVFDIVDNIHRDSAYSVLGEPSKNTLAKYARLEELEMKLDEYENGNTDMKLTSEESAELQTLRVWAENRKHKKHSEYAIQPDDLIGVSFNAKYKELIAKTVAEPISMRCRQAYTYWKSKGGDDSDGLNGILSRELQFIQTDPSRNKIVPLTPFARCKKVSVDAVLKTIFGDITEYNDIIQRVLNRIN